MMKRGLVMEGGAMRGMFTCGVIDVLMENGIDFNCAVGVSAGATFGLNIKSKQIGRGLRYNKIYCKDKRYASLRSLVKTGDIYNVKFCYDTLPYELDKWDYETFYSNPMEFYCVATDVSTGDAVYHKCDNYDPSPKGEDINWIRASASMPVVSRPVEIDGQSAVQISLATQLEFVVTQMLLPMLADVEFGGLVGDVDHALGRTATLIELHAQGLAIGLLSLADGHAQRQADVKVHLARCRLLYAQQMLVPLVALLIVNKVRASDGALHLVFAIDVYAGLEGELFGDDAILSPAVVLEAEIVGTAIGESCLQLTALVGTCGAANLVNNTCHLG